MSHLGVTIGPDSLSCRVEPLNYFGLSRAEQAIATISGLAIAGLWSLFVRRFTAADVIRT
jgi:hypothetical protein